MPRKSTILVVGANPTIGISMVREFLNNGDAAIATNSESNPEFVNNDVEWVQLDLTAENSIEIFQKGLARVKCK